MSKLNVTVGLGAVAFLLVFFGFWNAGGIAPWIIGAGVVVGILNILNIFEIGTHTEKKTNIILLTSGTILILLSGFTFAVPAVTSGALTVTPPHTEPTGVVQAGQEGSAILKLNVQRGGDGGTYANSGIVYALKQGVVSDRNDLMKKIYDGDTAALTQNQMSLTSGVFSKNGFASKIGDKVVFAGYLDNAPAATDNVSFVKEVTITGITSGSTPEWMLSDPNWVWYSYPTLLYYDPTSQASKVNYTEYEASAIEKTFSFDMFPTNNGEQWIDSDLWVESPSASIANIKRITISSPSAGVTTATYGMPQEVTSGENLFRAVPALVTSTDTMYHAGKFPVDLVRTSSTDANKGLYHITVTYDHPASGDVLYRFFVTQNSNALTSSGGHYDSPATSFKLNLTATSNAACNDLWNGAC